MIPTINQNLIIQCFKTVCRKKTIKSNKNEDLKNDLNHFYNHFFSCLTDNENMDYKDLTQTLTFVSKEIETAYNNHDSFL